MSYNYVYDQIIKRVHTDWLDFFRTLFYFGPQETKLVLVGQVPYINSETHQNQKVPQACGISFGVPKVHKKIFPSLANIFK